MSVSRLSRYRAERLLRKDFVGLRTKVLAVVRSQLRSKGVVLDAADLEACYAQAWHGLYATVLEGDVVDSPSAWLILVTFRRAIDEHRSARPPDPSRLFASTPDFAAQLDDRTRLRQVFEAMRTTLSERECEAASLCYLQGLSRADAAARMGVSEARMRKLMEGTSGRAGVAGKVGSLLETIKAGGWCEQQSSLMRAYAFGILDPEGERHALAVAHCRECPACRAHVASLRGLASVLPLPLLPRLGLVGRGTTTRSATGVRTAAKASSGLSGSLTAKLAVIATLVLGAGYGVLGSRAHGSTPTGRTAAPSELASPPGRVSPPIRLSKQIYDRSPATHHARTRARRPTRRSSQPRTHSVRKTRSAAALPGYEFAPERAQSQAPPTTSPHRSNGAGEFGLE
jgi:DNA-directed RNA polymerase specialized sigma24 family protein